MIIHPTMPDRTDVQRLIALEQANRVRTARAMLKRTITQDPEDARRVIQNPIADYRTMLLRDVLLALPLMGPQKVDRRMFHAAISPRKTLAGLTPRQREQALEIVSTYIAQRREVAA
jgi:hypothetical protein